MAADGTATPSRKSRILEVLEVLAKLIGASAVLVVALFANSLQGRLTGLSIQSQREQAESQLRANMFSSLVAPLGGQNGQPMSAEREVLLTKLLAYNFNENFEMKPLMEDAADRLAAESKKKSKDDDDPRESIWSVSRRIAERQRAAISREWSKYYETQSSKLSPFAFFLSPWKTSAESPAKGCEVYYVNFDSRRPQNGEPITTNENCQISATFRDIIDLK